jgi:hypothetical protein
MNICLERTMKLIFVVLFGALLVGCTAPGPATDPAAVIDFSQNR